MPDGKDGGRADKDEFVTVWRPGERTISIDGNHPFIKAVGASIPEGRTVDISFAEDAEMHMHGNAYMFCASVEIPQDLRVRMARDFDADACVRIKNIPLFISYLCDHPLLKGTTCASGRVRYEENNKVKEFLGNDVLLKKREYGWQREFRIIWAGNNIPATGAIIEVPSITPLLQRIF